MTARYTPPCGVCVALNPRSGEDYIASSFAWSLEDPKTSLVVGFWLVLLLRCSWAQLPSHICEGPLGCFASRDAPLVSSLTVSLYVCVPLQLVEHPGNTPVLSWQRERCNQSPSWKLPGHRFFFFYYRTQWQL